ncbi:hypothetical protein KBX19_05685 [Corynebacterium sp. CCUG 71335]|uniref:hypothetical protein n=1 Tax=Corynebacterium sp. CCUG 71335 TaxID=2823892 RepID=UPI00210BC395|nr:hypothetical protein [Corynebacterium sp. CCUG 71335]MCQ4620699.1 hypothetical protein [Corynebacterium sp. CCUG 71335]
MAKKLGGILVAAALAATGVNGTAAAEETDGSGAGSSQQGAGAPDPLCGGSFLRHR